MERGSQRHISHVAILVLPLHLPNFPSCTSFVLLIALAVVRLCVPEYHELVREQEADLTHFHPRRFAHPHQYSLSHYLLARTRKPPLFLYDPVACIGSALIRLARSVSDEQEKSAFHRTVELITDRHGSIGTSQSHSVA